MSVTINTDTGETGDMSTWVARFDELWRDGAINAYEFMTLLSQDIKLVAPGLRPTKGRKAGFEAFEKAFAVFPDLTGELIEWSANDNVLFIEMSFTATVGRKQIKWYNVDRFKFENGVAVERVAYFDQSALQRAFLGSPAGWLHLIRRLRSGL